MLIAAALQDLQRADIHIVLVGLRDLQRFDLFPIQFPFLQLELTTIKTRCGPSLSIPLP